MVPGITWTELHPECRERNPLLLTMPCCSSTTTIVYDAHAASPRYHLHHHHQRPPPPMIATHRPQRQRHARIPQENDMCATSPPKIDAATPRHTGKEQRPGATSLFATWQPNEQRTTSFIVIDNWVSNYPLSPPTIFSLWNPGVTTPMTLTVTNSRRHPR
jgi:hypothetical protein